MKNNCLHAGGVCFAELQPEGSEFRLREDEFGQKRVVEADLTYLCDLAVFYPKNIFLMTDGFSLERETELSTSEKEFCTLSASFSTDSANVSIRLYGIINPLRITTFSPDSDRYP